MRIGKLILALILPAYLLNFLWESIHAVFLYNGMGLMNARDFVLHIAYASSIDALLIAFAYFANVLLFKEIWWIKKTNVKKLALFSIIGLIIAMVIEYKAVFLFGQWSYTELMPTIFGMGLSPLLQLALTGLLSLWIAFRLTSQ